MRTDDIKKRIEEIVDDALGNTKALTARVKELEADGVPSGDIYAFRYGFTTQVLSAVLADLTRLTLRIGADNAAPVEWKESEGTEDKLAKVNDVHIETAAVLFTGGVWKWRWYASRLEESEVAAMEAAIAAARGLK